MAGDAKATKSRYTYISKPAGKIGFLVNIWKNEAENQRGRGWLSSTEEEMIELQRVAATSQQLQEGMRTIMQKAVAEKAAEANGGVMPDSIPEYIVNLNVIVAISGGFGSACALYTKKEDWLEIEYLVANTQMDGQFDAQKDVVKHLVAEAKKEGLKEVRLLARTHETLFGEHTDLGFRELKDGEEYSEYTDF